MKTQIQSTVAAANLARALVRACLWTAFGLLAAIATVSPPVRAAVTEAWVHRYNNDVGNSDDQAVKVVRDAAGDFIVTGNTGGIGGGIGGQNMLTIKYSGADGSVLWQKRYTYIARAMVVDGGGNVVVTGVKDLPSHMVDGQNPDIYTAKYAAADGALLWEKRLDEGEYDFASAVAVDGSGNVVVTGSSAIVKYAAADGALLWEKHYDGGATAVAVDSSGNVFVSGTSTNVVDGQWLAPDCYTVKYAAADGALLWEQRINNSMAVSVAVDGSGNVVVTGYDRIAKYAAADGALIWEKGNDGIAKATAVDGSGNVVVTGGYGFYTAKYAAADGALLWEKRYDGPANEPDEARAVAVDGSGNVVVTGYSTGSGSSHDYYTAKYAAADGALLWEKRYNGAAGDDDSANAVAVDGSGNVVVTGYSGDGVGGNGQFLGNDYYTAKYAAADGTLVWESRYNVPMSIPDEAHAVAVDGSGNVVVTGSSRDAGPYNYKDYYTAKYAATGGALLWEKRYDGPASSHDWAQAVAVDGSGNVVVTGTSSNGIDAGWPVNADYYTAKYAAAGGALLWEQRYNGPANSDDFVNALALDGSGNVVVTGRSYSGTNADCYTAKYAAGNGALLWEKRGPVGYSASVAVDGSGNVVVTGHSTGNPMGYYTAKYAAADGALLWEKRGPDGNDVSVAVDGSGDVVVTGHSFNGINPDNYTAKYAAADGTLLWEKRGPILYATALGVDGSGNVLVTGSSGEWPNLDYYTAKYAAADGALLWEQRFNGPANHLDEAAAVAVDSGGDVVVTGTSYNGIDVTGYPINAEYYTAKYAAADGALLWERRYNGPVNGYDNASGLALGPNGMVAITGSSFGDYATVVYRDTPPPVSFAAWAACSGLTGTAAAPNADPDSDGLPNGAEYILGGNPTVPGTSGGPTATTSGGNIILTFPRDDASETPDVTLTVETGTDLLTWPGVFNIGRDTAASSLGVSIAENGAAPDTVTVTIPQGQAARLFARLKVTTF